MDASVLMAAAGHQAGQERQHVRRQGSVQSRACGRQDLKALPQRLRMRITDRDCRLNCGPHLD